MALCLRRFSRNAGQCRRPAAGSRSFRRPRRSNQSGPPQRYCAVGNQTGVRKHRGFESHTLRQRKKGPLGPFLFLYREKFRACGRGAFVHFPPAESGQKGRRGAFLPKAKCPPDPPFAHSEDGFCSTPAPRLPRGFAFPQRKLSSPAGQKSRPASLTKRRWGAILVSVRTAAIAVAVVPHRSL